MSSSAKRDDDQRNIHEARRAETLQDCHLGAALADTLVELRDEHVLTDEDVLIAQYCFVEKMAAELVKEDGPVQTELNVKGIIDSYRSAQDLWTFECNELRITLPGEDGQRVQFVVSEKAVVHGYSHCRNMPTVKAKKKGRSNKKAATKQEKKTAKPPKAKDDKSTATSKAKSQNKSKSKSKSKSAQQANGNSHENNHDDDDDDDDDDGDDDDDDDDDDEDGDDDDNDEAHDMSDESD